MGERETARDLSPDGFLGKTGVFGLFRSEGLAGWGYCRRRPLPGLEGKQLPAAALYGGEGREGEESMVLAAGFMIRHYYGFDFSVRADVLFFKSNSHLARVT
jgi:hypothetical protein